MPPTPNLLSPRVLKLMKQIEIEKDRQALAQLFLELNLLLDEDDQKLRPMKKSARSIDSGQGRARRPHVV